MRTFRNLSAFVLGFAAIMLAGVASAQTDYDAITAAVDWADVITGIGVVAAAVAGVLIVMRGSRMLLAMIRR